MGSRLIIALLFLLKMSNSALVFDFLEDLTCPSNGTHITTTLVPYFNDFQYNWVDKHNSLSSLQDFLDSDTNYVTLAVDHHLPLPYGTKVCIQAMNDHYLKFINFEIRNMSKELDSRGYEQFNVLVRDNLDEFDNKMMNRHVDVFIYL